MSLAVASMEVKYINLPPSHKKLPVPWVGNSLSIRLAPEILQQAHGVSDLCPWLTLKGTVYVAMETLVAYCALLVLKEKA
jgi:hypothetical protein